MLKRSFQKRSLDMDLIDITEKTHDIIIDLFYGTEKNFTKQVIYTNPKCYLRKEALPLLEKAIELSNQQGLTLKIFDAFRPQKAQEILWSICPDSTYVMPPEKGSCHTRGIALDLTLVDQDSGKELDMGTPFDDFTPLSHHGAMVSKEANVNRYQLLGIMLSAGWDLNPKEWWHYQLFSPQSYPLIKENYGIL